jgi:hypothetical protein
MIPAAEQDRLASAESISALKDASLSATEMPWGHRIFAPAPEGR